MLNGTKPNGNILDFRGQQKEVDEAIALFSGEENAERAREIWLVDPAPAVIVKLEKAVAALDEFMTSQGLESLPEEVPNLRGDAARGQFINLFKEVQRLKTQLDQYTDLDVEQASSIAALLPVDRLQAFRGVYLETAQRLRAQQSQDGEMEGGAQELDFEFVLFASAMIDYDYIMKLIADYTQAKPERRSMSRDQLIGLIMADSKFVDEREAIAEYIRTLKVGEALDEKAIRSGYEAFKAEKSAQELAAIAAKQDLDVASLAAFVEGTMGRMIFDGDALSELLAPLDLSWKARTQKELDLMKELAPYLRKLAGGREISGLSAYEN